MTQHGKSHNDVKLGNFLVKKVVDGKPEVVLSDFGFMNQKGGTPLMASPECQIGTIVGQSDIFSLGGSFLNLISNNQIYAMLMMSPLMSEEEKIMAKEIQRKPIVALAKQMMHPNPFQRPDIDSVLEMIEEIDVEQFGMNLADDPNIQDLMDLWNVDLTDRAAEEAAPYSDYTRWELRRHLVGSG